MIEEPACSRRQCRHFRGIKQDDVYAAELTERPVCRAFPDGIPDDIAYGDNKHAEPVPNQGNDIVYERAK